MNPASWEKRGGPRCSAVVSSPGRDRVHEHHFETLLPCCPTWLGYGRLLPMEERHLRAMEQSSAVQSLQTDSMEERQSKEQWPPFLHSVTLWSEMNGLCGDLALPTGKWGLVAETVFTNYATRSPGCRSQWLANGPRTELTCVCFRGRQVKAAIFPTVSSPRSAALEASRSRLQS